ncbi:hypothetical protein BGZ70_000667 [Mortierella alpina]|uniref:Uncharacterized protein n=1 Tax=Mortierella alpina TaxID=64518 RepID=A0A9P6IZ95_MORAP|nr:hypothetical protein BGZ70_000667 [Mortierella alpina]
MERERDHIRALLKLQELQLRTYMATRRHVQQNPLSSVRYSVKVTGMKKVLDDRHEKICVLRKVLEAYDEDRSIARMREMLMETPPSTTSSLQESDEISGSFVAQVNNDINSEKIDFSRLLPKTLPDEPEWKLRLQGKDESTALEIPVHDEGLSQGWNRGVLVGGVTRDNGQGLGDPIEDVQEADGPVYFDYTSIDTWFPIEKCVSELFRVDLLKSDAVKPLFALDTSTFTDVHAYAGKVELLMEASGLKDSSYETLILEPFIQFPGLKTDWAKWFKARFTSFDGNGQGSSTIIVAAGKNPTSPQPNKGKHPRKEARQPFMLREQYIFKYVYKGHDRAKFKATPDKDGKSAAPAGTNNDQQSTGDKGATSKAKKKAKSKTVVTKTASKFEGSDQLHDTGDNYGPRRYGYRSDSRRDDRGVNRDWMSSEKGERFCQKGRCFKYEESGHRAQECMSERRNNIRSNNGYSNQRQGPPQYRGQRQYHPERTTNVDLTLEKPVNETAKKEAQEVNLRVYDEADRELQQLKSNIERCERAFRLSAIIAGRRLLLENLSAPPNEIAAPSNGVVAADLNGNNQRRDNVSMHHQLKINDDMPRFYQNTDPRQFLDQLKHMGLEFESAGADVRSVEALDDQLSMFQKLERGVKEADKDKQEALVRYVDTKADVRRLKQVDSMDAAPSDDQRRHNAKKHDAKMEDAQRDLERVVRDFDPAHRYWMQFATAIPRKRLSR